MKEILKDYLYAIGFLIILCLLITAHRDESAIEAKIFDDVNDVRINQGTHDLTRNSNLDTLAKNHSIKMKPIILKPREVSLQWRDEVTDGSVLKKWEYINTVDCLLSLKI